MMNLRVSWGTESQTATVPTPATSAVCESRRSSASIHPDLAGVGIAAAVPHVVCHRSFESFGSVEGAPVAHSGAPSGSAWQTVRELADRWGITKYEARKRISSERLPVRRTGNRDEYLAPTTSELLLETESVVRFEELTSETQRQRVLAREAAVQFLQSVIASGNGIETALHATCKRLAIHPGTLRRWWKAYESRGIGGLVDQSSGARDSFVDAIPDHLLDRVRAASIEHGTLGRNGRQNFARAVRQVLVGSNELPAEARMHIHEAHASKSYVPQKLRDRLRVSPQARDIVQGEHAEKLNGPYTNCDWSGVPAGRVLTGDDMTANAYVWVEWPGELGYIVVRPQIIALLDCGTLRWVGARVVVRSKGQYNTDDVWGVIGDAFDTHGVWNEVLFEGGAIWQGSKIRGLRTDLGNDERVGGLKSLGVIVHHSRLPRSKPIEERFNQLQYLADACAGSSGRREREDAPEDLEKALRLAKSGQKHPRLMGIPHVSEYRRHVERCMAQLNEERNDGRILRGMTPNEKWNVDAPQMPAMSESARWMFRSNVSVTQVRRDGMIKVSTGSGATAWHHLYRHECLQDRAGMRVLCYWNDSNPEAAAVVLGAHDHKYVCTAEYAPAIPRFDATDEQLRKEAEAKAAYHQHARSEVVNLAPYLVRGVRNLEATDRGEAVEAPQLRDVGNRLSQSDTTQRTEERTHARVRAASRRVDLSDAEVARALVPDEPSIDDELSPEEVERLFAPAPVADNEP